MADKKRELEIVLSAKDEATAKLKKAGGALETLSGAIKKARVASIAFGAALTLGARSVLKASSEYERSMIGLSTVADAFSVSQEAATQGAKDLAKDGLMSVRDAAEGLKNLLATGFSLPEAIDLMNGFKDSAAFNRQGMLGFGESIVGATQGLKNQNSIMVDNAGVTKNLSIILKEAGYSQGDLGRVTSDAAVRTALYNGLLKETAIFAGDAEKATETYQGRVDQLNTKIFDLKVLIGNKLLPIATKFIEEGLIPWIERTMELVEYLEQHKVMAIILAGAIVGALIPAVISAIAAFASLALTLAPFIIAGGIFAAVYAFLDFVSMKTTGFTLLEQLEASIWLVKKAFQDFILWVDKAIDRIDKFLGKASKAKGTKSDGGGSWQHGGFVEAPYGQAVPAILHGGERVIPRTGTDVNQGGGGISGGLTLNFTGPISMDSDERVNDLAQKIISILGRQNELASKGLAI